MRQYCLFLLIGLLASAFLQSSVMCRDSSDPSECCFSYYNKQIPIAKINSYMETSVQCTGKPGVIFFTKKGLRICVDPQKSWVKSAMKAVDDRDF